MLTGTITSFYQSSSSSSFIKNAQAQSIDNLLKDIGCDNINLNGNDISIDTLPQSLGGLADLIKAESGDSVISNSEQRAINDFLFKCINNNENEFSESQTPPQPPLEGATLSINKEWFVCNNDDIDCIIEPQVEGEQISFEGPNSGNYIQCTSDGQCPFANDAGFNIEITGNSPTPNTIPAQINTEQQVQIGAGPYSVTEDLFLNRFVPNAIFDVQNVPVGNMAFSRIPPTMIIAFDAAGDRVFTANEDTNTVSIIDLTDNSVTNIPLGPDANSPLAITFDAAGERVLTANQDSDSVSIIDLIDNSVTNVPLADGARPIAIAFDEVGERVFTANVDGDSVSIIDLDNPITVTNVAVGNGPRTVTFDAAGQRLFVPNGGGNSVSVIDLNTNNVTPIIVGFVGPVAIAFDEGGQRLFTANEDTNTVSIIDLENSNPVTNVPVGARPIAIAFDEIENRVFTANIEGDSVSIIDLANSNAVTNIDLGFGSAPSSIAFEEARERVFTTNLGSDSVSIIDLENSNAVTNIDLSSSGGNRPLKIVFDEAEQRIFTANEGSNSVSIIDLTSTIISKICQDSGFDTGDVRTFVSGQLTLEQITCVNFVGQCSGNIDNGETRECTVEDYIVSLAEVPSNGESGIGILSSNIDKSQQQDQLFTNDIFNTENKLKTQSLPTGPFIYDMSKH